MDALIADFNRRGFEADGADPDSFYGDSQRVIVFGHTAGGRLIVFDDRTGVGREVDPSHVRLVLDSRGNPKVVRLNDSDHVKYAVAEQLLVREAAAS